MPVRLAASLCQCCVLDFLRVSRVKFKLIRVCIYIRLVHHHHHGQLEHWPWLILGLDEWQYFDHLTLCVLVDHNLIANHRLSIHSKKKSTSFLLSNLCSFFWRGFDHHWNVLLVNHYHRFKMNSYENSRGVESVFISKRCNLMTCCVKKFPKLHFRKQLFLLHLFLWQWSPFKIVCCLVVEEKQTKQNKQRRNERRKRYDDFLVASWWWCLLCCEVACCLAIRKSLFLRLIISLWVWWPSLFLLVFSRPTLRTYDGSSFSCFLVDG